MKRPKMKKTDVEKGLGKNRKNMEVNDMGDLRGDESGFREVADQEDEGSQGWRREEDELNFCRLTWWIIPLQCCNLLNATIPSNFVFI